MGFTSAWHWIVVLLVVLLLFGAGKIPRLMGDAARGIKEFKKGMREDDASEDETKQLKSESGEEVGAAKEKDTASKS